MGSAAESSCSGAVGARLTGTVNTDKVVEFRLDDVVELRKPHPCGGMHWTVVRLGADIGVRCISCGHRVLLERRVLERRMKGFVERGAAPPSLANSTPA